jgi:hypothetical protein
MLPTCSQCATHQRPVHYPPVNSALPTSNQCTSRLSSCRVSHTQKRPCISYPPATSNKYQQFLMFCQQHPVHDIHQCPPGHPAAPSTQYPPVPSRLRLPSSTQCTTHQHPDHDATNRTPPCSTQYTSICTHYRHTNNQSTLLSMTPNPDSAMRHTITQGTNCHHSFFLPHSQRHHSFLQNRLSSYSGAHPLPSVPLKTQYPMLNA